MLVAFVAAATLVLSAPSRAETNVAARPFMLKRVLAAGNTGDSTVFAYGRGMDCGSLRGGMIAVRVWSDTLASGVKDSTSVDSVAVELFLYTAAGIDSTSRSLGADSARVVPTVGDSTHYAPVDLNDSNARLDGFFLTALDSTALYNPRNLTPETGAAASQPKFPYDVSSRVIVSRPTLTASGVAIPGAILAAHLGTTNPRFAMPATHDACRWFYIPLTDAYGATLVGMHNINVGILNRHPRLKYYVSAYLLGASD